MTPVSAPADFDEVDRVPSLLLTENSGPSDRARGRGVNVAKDGYDKEVGKRKMRGTVINRGKGNAGNIRVIERPWLAKF